MSLLPSLLPSSHTPTCHRDGQFDSGIVTSPTWANFAELVKYVPGDFSRWVRGAAAHVLFWLMPEGPKHAPPHLEFNGKNRPVYDEGDLQYVLHDGRKKRLNYWNCWIDNFLIEGYIRLGLHFFSFTSVGNLRMPDRAENWERKDEAVLTYRVTIPDGNNLLLTWIWNVPSSCLGSR